MDLSHIETWVFDLDNTLYPPSARLFDQIETLMETFISRELSVSAAEARHLRDHYWETHGTTLAGLEAEHNITPDHFLAETHAIDLSPLMPDPALAERIAALPGTKVIYTNGPRFHGQRVAEARALTSAFSAIYGTEDAHYIAKPARAAFETVFAAAGITPTRAAMIEDTRANLAAPRDMGMTTILVGSTDPTGVDIIAPDVASFLDSLRSSGGLASGGQHHISPL